MATTITFIFDVRVGIVFPPGKQMNLTSRSFIRFYKRLLYSTIENGGLGTKL